MVFQWLMLHKEMTLRNYNLLVVYRELFSREWRVELHRMKEANQVADGLAHFGRRQDIGFHVEWLTLLVLVEEAMFQWLMLHKEMTLRNYNLLVVYRELFSREWRVELHRMKEANQVADGLAHFGRRQDIGFHVEWLTLLALVEEAM